MNKRKWVNTVGTFKLSRNLHGWNAARQLQTIARSSQPTDLQKNVCFLQKFQYDLNEYLIIMYDYPCHWEKLI